MRTIVKFKTVLMFSDGNENNPQIKTDNPVLWIKAGDTWFKPLSKYTEKNILQHIDEIDTPQELLYYLFQLGL